MRQKYCFVIDKTNKPLAPTKKWDIIYRKLKNGTAKIVRKKPFTVQFIDKEIPDDKIVKSTLCLDPGRTTGVAVVKNNTHEIVFRAEFTIESHKIAKKMKERKIFKRRRKYYQRQKRIRRAIKCDTVFEGEKEFKFPGMNKGGVKCKYIRPKSPRYLNRKKKHKFTTTVEYFLHSLLRLIKDLSKIIAIDSVKIEFVPFDIRKLQEPWIRGYLYQKSNKGNFSTWLEYIKYRDNYKCVKCGSTVDLEAHHIKPVSNGGRDHPKNLITLCRNCHQEIHIDTKEFKKWTKKFEKYIKKVEKKAIKDNDLRYSSYMNQIMKDLLNELKNKYNVKLESPKFVIDNRKLLDIEKTHYNDASALYGKNVKIDNELKIFYIRQFPKHNRRATMGIEDRLYCYKPKSKISKPVVYNRRQKMHQNKPSLLDLVGQKGKEETGKITVYRKGNIRYRSHNQKYFQGFTILYEENDKEYSGIVILTKTRNKYVKLHNNKKIKFKQIKKIICKRILFYE